MNVDNLELMKDLDLGDDREFTVEELIEEGHDLEVELKLARTRQEEAKGKLRVALDESNKADTWLDHIDKEWTNNQLTRQEIYEQTTIYKTLD